jgi:hypothetical protein
MPGSIHLYGGIAWSWFARHQNIDPHQRLSLFYWNGAGWVKVPGLPENPDGSSAGQGDWSRAAGSRYEPYSQPTIVTAKLQRDAFQEGEKSAPYDCTVWKANPETLSFDSVTYTLWQGMFGAVPNEGMPYSESTDRGKSVFATFCRRSGDHLIFTMEDSHLDGNGVNAVRNTFYLNVVDGSAPVQVGYSMIDYMGYHSSTAWDKTIGETWNMRFHTDGEMYRSTAGAQLADSLLIRRRLGGGGLESFTYYPANTDLNTPKGLSFPQKLNNFRYFISSQLTSRKTNPDGSTQGMETGTLWELLTSNSTSQQVIPPRDPQEMSYFTSEVFAPVKLPDGSVVISMETGGLDTHKIHRVTWE